MKKLCKSILKLEVIERTFLYGTSTGSTKGLMGLSMEQRYIYVEVRKGAGWSEEWHWYVRKSSVSHVVGVHSRWSENNC